MNTPANAEARTPVVTVDPNYVPPGTKIDDVFNVFANLAPASPWSAHLRTIQTIFNKLAEGVTLIDTCPHVNLAQLIVLPEDIGATEEPIASGAAQWNEGVALLIGAMSMMRPVPKVNEPKPDVIETEETA